MKVNPIRLERFAWGPATLLLGITFASGFMIGAAGGWLWNRFATAE